jgi:glycosyltransferase involved in cell wall biosynthesis
VPLDPARQHHRPTLARGLVALAAEHRHLGAGVAKGLEETTAVDDVPRVRRVGAVPADPEAPHPGSVGIPSPQPEGALITAASALEVLAVSHAPTPWGAERRLLDLAPELRDRGIVLTLAAPDGELAGLWRALGLRHVRIRPASAQGLRRDDGSRPGPVQLAGQTAETLRAAVALRRLARSTGAHLLHSHGLTAHLEVAIAGRLARRPVVLDLHDIVVPGVGRRVLDTAARLADTVIANSAATAATVTAGRVEIVNPGVDRDRFHPAPADWRVRAELTAAPAAPLVAILGRVDPEKGIDVVLRAVAAVPDCHLAVVGAPNVAGAEFGAGLERLGAALLGDRVRFTGARADVPDVLRAVDVLVNASQAEPFGRTVLEAQACGVPVIGTRSGGIPEFVRDGESGLLVPPGDVDALAAALRRLLDSSPLRDAVRAGGLANAERLAVPNQVEKVAAIYRRVAGR